MLNRLFTYFSLNSRLQRNHKRISSLSSRIASLEADREELGRKLRKEKKALETPFLFVKREITEREESLAVLAEEAKAIERRYKEELEIARSKTTAAEQAVIALAAQNRSLIEMWNAETAVQIRRQAAAMPREE